MRILLLPLDGRPCNTELPRSIAAVASHEVRVPPAEMLGNSVRPADTDALVRFLAREGAEADAIVASMDLLVQGGIGAARGASLDIDTAFARADRALTALRPFADKTVIVSSIPRSSIPYTSEALLTAWPDVARYNTLRTLDMTPDAEAERAALLTRIPGPTMTERAFARKRDHILQRRYAEALRKGSVSRIVFVQDDAEPEVSRARETEELRQLTRDLDVTFMPGTDGVFPLLVASSILDEDAPVLRLGVMVSDAPGMGRTALYELAEFRESLHSCLRPLGWVIDNSNPEVHLYVHPPAAKSRDLFLDEPTEPSPVLDEFVELLSQGVSAGKTIFLADCAHVNGADRRLLDAIPKDTLGGLAGFGASSTASNTLGSVLAHAALLAFGVRRAQWSVSESSRLTRLRLLDDWLFQSMARRELDLYCQHHAIDRFGFGAAAGEMDRRLDTRMQALARERLPAGTPPFRARFPWNRLLETEIQWQ